MSTLDLSFPGLDSAIAQFEGGLTAGSLQSINNNPGNLTYAQWESNYGATQGAGGFAAFPNLTSGASAEDSLVSYYANQPGETLSQMLNSWAPSSAGNPTQNYINYVFGQTGINPTQPIIGQSGATSGGSWLQNLLGNFGGLNMPSSTLEIPGESNLSIGIGGYGLTSISPRLNRKPWEKMRFGTATPADIRKAGQYTA